MNEEAETLFTKIFLRSNSKFLEISQIRKVSSHGSTIAMIKTSEEAYQFFMEMSEDSSYDQFFNDKKKAFEILGGVEVASKQMAEKQFLAYQFSIDAISIILAHSSLDADAIDYCRVIEIGFPSEFEKFVLNKKITVNEIKERGGEAVIKDEIREYIAGLERESLIVKVDKIHEICQPPKDLIIMTDYRFDRDRLVMLDELRHKIVHGDISKEPIINCSDHIYYLQKTSVYLMGLLNKKFKIKMNSALWQNGLMSK